MLEIVINLLVNLKLQCVKHEFNNKIIIIKKDMMVMLLWAVAKIQFETSFSNVFLFYIHVLLFFSLYCAKTMGGLIIELVFTAWFPWRSKIDGTCGGRCCTFQILTFQKAKKGAREREKKMSRETKTIGLVEKRSLIWLCGKALIAGRRLCGSDVRESVQPTVSLFIRIICCCTSTDIWLRGKKWWT